MSLQMRITDGGSRIYNPNRDVAHHFGHAVAEVAARLEDEVWPSLSAMLTRDGITQDQLGEACRAYCEFVMSSCDNAGESCEEALERCGWFKLPPPVQIAYAATLGAVMSGYFYAGVRDASIGDDLPLASYRDLRLVGRRVAKHMARPAWLRATLSYIRRFRSWLFGIEV